jgi:hypothetical protein
MVVLICGAANAECDGRGQTPRRDRGRARLLKSLDRIGKQDGAGYNRKSVSEVIKPMKA